MHQKSPIILAIESSCDETSSAVIMGCKILANITTTQAIHEQYGGVVPELASRAHLQNIVPIVNTSIEKAGIALNEIDAIAYTRGPGLLGALLVGTSFAKAMALALNKPLIEVNHMQAHILAHFIENNENPPPFPFLCLTVSGGHTQIVLVKSPLEFKILGETIDDAAGEAFDKVAKTLGIAYPGGPLVDKFAKNGDNQKFKFPYPQIQNYDYSFSGIKTSFLYFIQDNLKRDSAFIEKNLEDICASIQYHIVSYLLKKFLKAAKDLKIKHLAIAGGVSANSELRKQITDIKQKGYTIYIPPFEYCTDNAGMIAIAAYFKYIKNEFSDQHAVPLARMPIC